MSLTWSHRCGGISLREPCVMGILNVTPDSFSDGGAFLRMEDAVDHGLALEEEGAHILDIGAQSTRPGFVPLNPEEEWNRLSPVIQRLRPLVCIPISVDTYYPDVALQAIEAGADIINDVSGNLTEMPAICQKTGAGLVSTHNGENGDSPEAIIAFFTKAIAAAETAKMPLSQLCLDVGIGFGKSRTTELEAVRSLPKMLEAVPGVPLMVGGSRKRVIAAAGGDCPPDQRLFGTIAFHTVALYLGAHIIRVHDVAAAVQAARVTQALKTGIIETDCLL